MDTNLARSGLGQVLDKHKYDTLSQDSGRQCICGSDSRFVQKFEHRVDEKWNSFGEHLADVSIYYLRLWGVS